MSAGRASRIWHRTRVGAALALGLGLLLWLASSPWGVGITLAAGTLMALAGVGEARRMGTLAERSEAVAAGIACVAAALVVLLAGSGGDSGQQVRGLSERYWLVPLGILGVGALAAGAVSSTGRAAGLGRRVALILWLAAPLPLLAHLQGHYGFPTLGVCLLLAKIGDVAGYYAGSLLGGRFPQHPFPRVSPGKTSVGCLASLLAATAAGLAAAALGWLPAGRLGLLSGALAGALVNVAAQGGDLLESAAKRRAGVKDSGTLFGPSGGVLDLVDSLLLAVPVAVLVWPLLFA